jgi:hypothetical protein
MGTLKKRPERETLQDVPPFTLESLRDLLANEVIGPKLTMPGNDQIAELARILNGWQEHYFIEQDMRYVVEIKKEALTALTTLDKAYSQLKEVHQRFEADAMNEGAPSAICEILESKLVEIEVVQGFIAKMESSTVLAETSSGPDRGWLWLAHVLPKDFRNAMLPNNPTFGDGIGHNGPLARFIAAVTPSLTGQRPTRGSVATQLKALRGG